MQQEQNSLKESTHTTSLKKRYEKNEKIKVYYPNSIFGDVAYLHNLYKNVEWSGYLYYNVQGSIEDAGNMSIYVKEFVLLDIGSGASTDVRPTGEQVVDMFENRPQIIEQQLKQGLQHSHHNMGVFFSGTDWDTLLENASEYDFFLSVIVNSKGDIIGKVSQRGEITSVNKYKYRFKFNEIISEPITKVEEVIFVYDCEMILQSPIHLEIKALDIIHKEKEKIREEARLIELQNRPTYQSANGWDYGGNKKPIQYNMFDNKTHKSSIIDNDMEDDWRIEAPLKPMSIKERVELFIKACIVIDNDLEMVDKISYQKCKEEFEIDWKKQKLEKEFEEELNENFADIFLEVFDYPDLQDLNIVENIFKSTIKDGVVERIIKRSFNTFVEGYKMEFLT